MIGYYQAYGKIKYATSIAHQISSWETNCFQFCVWQLKPIRCTGKSNFQVFVTNSILNHIASAVNLHYFP